MMGYVVGLAIVLFGALAGLLSPAHAEKRVALVIGNSRCEHIAALPNVANDAKAMAVLLEAAGFDSVELLRDQRAADLRRSLRKLADRAAGADVAVLFYAGHGIEVDRANYLIPVDARLRSDLDVADETVSLDRVLQLMEPARRLRVVLLDACRDNPFAKSMKLTAPTRSVGRGLGRIEAGGANTLIAFATEPYGVAEDGAGSNSPFTAALVKHLATPGLDLRLALGSVRDEVMASTNAKQKPYVTSSLGGGVFSIVPKGSDPAGLTPGQPADLAWAAVKDSEEIEALETFRQHYGKERPVYDRLAALRIEALKGQRRIKRGSQYAGLRIGMPPKKVLHMKGNPFDVLEMETKGQHRGAARVIPLKEIEKGKSIEDYRMWTYFLDSEKNTDLIVEFDDGMVGLIDIHCVSHIAANQTTSSPIGRCPPLAGIVDGDSVKEVLDKVGTPDKVKFGSDGSINRMEYTKLGVYFYLQRQQVYFLGVRVPE